MITGLFILPKARQKTELFLTRRAGSQAAGEEGVGTLNKQQLEATECDPDIASVPGPRSQGPGAMIDEWWCWLQLTAGVSPPRAAAGATNSYH